jgi:hypothetical protein
VTPVVVARHGHKSFFFEPVATGLTCLVADGNRCFVDVAVIVIIDVHSIAVVAFDIHGVADVVET